MAKTKPETKPNATVNKRIIKMEAVIQYLSTSGPKVKFSHIKGHLIDLNLEVSNGNLTYMLVHLMNMKLISRKRIVKAENGNKGSTGYFYKITALGHKVTFTPESFMDLKEIKEVKEAKVSIIRELAFSFMELTCDRGMTKTQKLYLDKQTGLISKTV